MSDSGLCGACKAGKPTALKSCPGCREIAAERAKLALPAEPVSKWAPYWRIQRGASPSRGGGYREAGDVAPLVLVRGASRNDGRWTIAFGVALIVASVLGIVLGAQAGWSWCFGAFLSVFTLTGVICVVQGWTMLAIVTTILVDDGHLIVRWGRYLSDPTEQRVPIASVRRFWIHGLHKTSRGPKGADYRTTSMRLHALLDDGSSLAITDGFAGDLRSLQAHLEAHLRVEHDPSLTRIDTAFEETKRD